MSRAIATAPTTASVSSVTNAKLRSTYSLLPFLCIDLTDDRMLALIQCGNFAQRHAKRSGDTVAVGRVGLEAIADVANLDFPRCASNGTRRVFKQRLLLSRCHQTEELSRL